MIGVEQIIGDVKRGDIKPIYFLMGEEPYRIDMLSDYLENNLLAEEEKGFNQMVLYGRDVTIDEIVSNAKRFPMMAERQVIIVKEAQDLSRTIENLSDYAKQPTPTTVLVVCYKYKTLDKRKSLSKLIAKNGELFQSDKLYENKVADWIRKTLSKSKYNIEPKAAQMLVEFLGNDLSKIKNELDKLMLIIPSGATITPNHIEENIGISKDFNVFELRKAVGERQIAKANQIINYFAQNPKSHPIVMTVTLLNSYFVQLLQYHGLKDKSKGNVAKALRINPYFVGDYIVASRNYPMRKVSQIVGYLRDADVRSKGVGANQKDGDILKELLFKIMH